MFDLNKDKLATGYNIAHVEFKICLVVSAIVKLIIFGEIVSAIFDFF